MAMLPKNGRSELVKMRFENEKENEDGRAMLPGRFMPDGIEHYLSSQS